MQSLKVDGGRLWHSLMELARVGATPKGGVCRLALTDADREGRDLFVRWCETAGCTISVDRIGNIFARRPGGDDSLAPVLAGSHLDSQPTGGKFDGAYGVLAALEVVRTLDDSGVRTKAPVEIVAWTNEEGSRFSPPMMGSGVFTGAFDLDYALGRADEHGATVGQELGRIGYAGELQPGGRPVGAYFEAHIEQGPVLEAEGKVIGVVTGAQAQRWYEATVTGQEAHAGPTPMESRRDALLGAARMVAEVNRIGLAHLPQACATVGMMRVHPNSRNVIPGQVFFTVDLRHPEDRALATMDREMRAAFERLAGAAGLGLDIDNFFYFPPTPFDEGCIRAVREATEQCGFEHMDIVSGAGHDAVYMAKVAPTGMIFVPCEGGISHNETESATPEDLEAGCNVLLRAVLSHAGAG